MDNSVLTQILDKITKASLDQPKTWVLGESDIWVCKYNRRILNGDPPEILCTNRKLLLILDSFFDSNSPCFRKIITNLNTLDSESHPNPHIPIGTLAYGIGQYGLGKGIPDFVTALIHKIAKLNNW